VEEAAVHHRLEGAAQARKLERVGESELGVNSAVLGLLSGDCECGLGDVDSENREAQRGYVKSVLAGAAAGVEHGSGECAMGCQTHYDWLRVVDVPRRGGVVEVRRIPGETGHPFVAGRVSTAERIVSGGSRLLRHLSAPGPLPNPALSLT